MYDRPAWRGYREALDAHWRAVLESPAAPAEALRAVARALRSR
jgi:hypothetical protein